MNLAYIIIGHKNFGQILRLINRLDDDRSRFVVMIDAKSPADEFEALKQSLAGNTRVTMMPRVKIGWGDVTLTFANRTAIREFLRSGFPFDYVLSVSGQDYPLMKPDDLRKILATGNGRSFLLCEPFPVKRWDAGCMGRMYSWNFIRDRRVYQFPKWAPARRWWARCLYVFINRVVPGRGPFPLNMHPYGGSTHWTLSHEAAQYIDCFTRENPAFDLRFKRTLHSDETYFQTILANSPLKDRIINTDLRYMRWPTADAPSPIVLTQKNLPEILASDAAFARKFDVTEDETVLDLIDEHVDAKDNPTEE